MAISMSFNISVEMFLLAVYICLPKNQMTAFPASQDMDWNDYSFYNL